MESHSSKILMFLLTIYFSEQFDNDTILRTLCIRHSYKEELVVARCSERGELECGCKCRNTSSELPWTPSDLPQERGLCHCIAHYNSPDIVDLFQWGVPSFKSSPPRNASCVLYTEKNCFLDTTGYCDNYHVALGNNELYSSNREDSGVTAKFKRRSFWVKDGCSVTRNVTESVCSLTQSQKLEVLNTSGNFDKLYTSQLEVFKCLCHTNSNNDTNSIPVGLRQAAIGATVVLVLLVLVAAILLVRNRENRKVRFQRAYPKSLRLLNEYKLIDQYPDSRSVPNRIDPNGPKWTRQHYTKINPTGHLCLGEGAFGKVFDALNTKTGSRPVKVAIKQIDINFAHCKLRRGIQRIVDEARVLREMRNEHIVTCHDYWIEGPLGEMELDAILNHFKDWSSKNPEYSGYYLFIEMELCQSDLAKWLHKFVTIDERLMDQDICSMFHQILSGLKGIHDLGVIHRDIKPNNFLCFGTTQEGVTWKIGDFGLSREVGVGCNSLSVVGSEAYRSIEMGKWDYTEKTDIFSLGLVFLEVLCPSLRDPKRKYELFDKVRLGGCLDLETLSTFGCEICQPFATLVEQLVMKMLVNDYKNRFDVNECLRQVGFNIHKQMG